MYVYMIVCVYACVCVHGCACVCVCIGVDALREMVVLGSLDQLLQVVVNPTLSGCCEQNWEPLQRKHKLLATEPSLWPLLNVFLLMCDLSSFTFKRTPVTQPLTCLLSYIKLLYFFWCVCLCVFCFVSLRCCASRSPIFLSVSL